MNAIKFSLLLSLSHCFAFGMHHSERIHDLIEATYRGNHVRVKQLIDSGVDVNEQFDGDTALGIAAAVGSLENTKLLLDAGARVNIKNKCGDAPINRAVCGSGTDDLNSQRRTEIVKLLLAKNACVDAKDRHGITVLMKAAYNGHIDIVRLLLKAGAKVNEKSEKGYTASNYVASGNQEIAHLLESSTINRDRP